MNKKVYVNAEGWRMVSTAKAVTTFRPVSRGAKILLLAPMWAPMLIFLVMITCIERDLLLGMFCSMALLVGFFSWLLLQLQRNEVNRKFFLHSTQLRWRTADCVLASDPDEPDTVFIVNRSRGQSFAVWRGSDKEDRETVKRQLWRFIPVDGPETGEV